MMTGLAIDFQGPAFIWAVMAGAVVASGLLYLPAVRAVGRAKTGLLMTLRCLAVACLLLFLLRPVVSWAGSEAGDTLLVLVDHSASMGVVDESKTRLAAAIECLAQGEDPLLDDFGRHLDVRLFAFGARPRAIAGGADLEKLKPCDEVTDVAGSVREALASCRGARPVGVLLVTDGIHNAQSDAGDIQVPVLALAVGGRPGQSRDFKDLAVDRVIGSDSVFLGGRHEIEVRVSARGMGRREVPVIIRRGEMRVAETVAVLGESGETATVVIGFTPEKEGMIDYEVSVPVIEGEAIAGNNVYRFPLHVLTGKIPVLYIEGALRWEYKYLRKALAADPHVEIVSLIRTGTGLFYQQGKGEPVVRDGKLELTRDSLLRFSVVILGDIEPGAFRNDQLDALRWFVDEKGGGLVMLGGASTFGQGTWAGTPLAVALPVWMGRVPRERIKGPVHARLTTEGEGHPVLAGCASFFAEGSDLPPLDGLCLAPGPRPAASVLAVAEGSHDTVLAVQRYGSGKTAALLADTTWKWYLRMRGMGRKSPYNKMWMQLLRWLSGEGAAPDEGSPLAVRSDRRIYRVGELVRGEVRLLHLKGVPEVAGQPNLWVVPEKGAALRVDLDGEPPVFSGLFEAARPGIYSLRAQIRSADGRTFERTAAFAVGGRGREFERIDADIDYLKELAVRTGGDVFTLAEAQALPERLKELLREQGSRRETGPFRSPLFFLAFLAFLGIEWALRRRSMLV
jgi:uncharacterized membrane protein